MEVTVLDWLEKTKEAFFDKSAFEDEEKSITFGEVYETARRIGSRLCHKVKMKSPVIVMTGRHVYTPVCYLGVVYAGGFYVPLDGSMPAERLQKIVGVVQAPVMIVDAEYEEMAGKLGFEGEILSMEQLMAPGEIEEEALAEIRSGMASDMPLYVIFTSGSSGMPKGVITAHYSLMNYISGVSGVLGIHAADRIGNQSPLDYIAAVRDIYFPLKTGATTLIIPKKYFAVPVKLLELLNERRITTVCWSASALTIPARMGALREWKAQTLKKICFSGSVMPGSVLREWQEHLQGGLFVNQYGPTEATASCTYYVVRELAEEDSRIPIGKPYPQYRILLLNEDMTETAFGEIGEICVLGPVLALGYYGDQERTEAAFIQNPLNPNYRELLYRTGDLGRFREDGELEFHGRKDRQFKHLGHRVEPEEIEAAAATVEGIKSACALYYSKKELIYLFYEGSASEKEAAIKLREILPAFMVPRRIVTLEKMPVLPNGKTDMETLKTYFK